MAYLGIIISLLGGVLAAASLIIKFKEESKELIEKVTPYQGIVGVILLFWGLWDVL